MLFRLLPMSLFKFAPVQSLCVFFAGFFAIVPFTANSESNTFKVLVWLKIYRFRCHQFDGWLGFTNRNFRLMVLFVHSAWFRMNFN
jgi:hypothetical protein